LLRYALDESGCLGMQPKMGGKFHLKLNIGTRPIANKYREGKMKSTLKRESKVRETVLREPIEVSMAVLTLTLGATRRLWVVAQAPPRSRDLFPSAFVGAAGQYRFGAREKGGRKVARRGNPRRVTFGRLRCVLDRGRRSALSGKLSVAVPGAGRLHVSVLAPGGVTPAGRTHAAADTGEMASTDPS
jgi:hypothetical protein